MSGFNTNVGASGGGGPGIHVSAPGCCGPQDRQGHVTDTGRIFYPYNRHLGSSTISTFAIGVDNPVVPRWGMISTGAIRKLNRAGLRWEAVECFRRRQGWKEFDKDDDDTTIVITLRDLPPVTNDCRLLLQNLHFLSGCRFVELTQGRIRRGNQDELSEESKNELSRELEERLPQWIPYQIKPPMGSSIGVSDKNWSTGTFGGYVELENGVKEKKMCGITCHHVLRPAVDKKPPPEDHFSPFIAGETGGSIICHPSLGGHNTTVLAQERVTKSYKAPLEKKEAFEDFDPRTKKNQDALREKIDNSEELTRLATSADREIGRVFATSGFAVRNYEKKKKHQLDWGLIELKPERVGTNSDSANEFWKPDVPVAITSEQLSGSRVSDSTRVRQIGCRSGLVTGVVNGVRSCIFFERTNHEITTDEWAVVTESPDYCFSTPGDSGALVTTVPDAQAPKSRVVGLLWGSKEDKLSASGEEACYITSINEVADHIREITGYSVRVIE